LANLSWRNTLAVLGTAVITLAACGAAQPSAPTAAAPTVAAPTAAAPTSAPATRGQGGELKIIYWQAVTNPNSHHAQGTKDFDGARLVIEPLAAMGPEGKPIAVLAAEVPTLQNGGVSADLTTVTWKLKPNVKWSDGTEFTAADVVFTWKYVSDPATAATTSGVFDGVKSVEATDKLTVKVTYAAPNPNFYQAYVSGLANILQEKQYKDFIGAKAKDGPAVPIGTGPYKILDFKPNDVVTYSINENYRDPGKPFFKTVQFKGGGDAVGAARAVFQTGESDYSWNLQVEANILKPMIEAADSKGTFVSATSANVERILLNRTDIRASAGANRGEPTTQHPFLSDLKVRQALAMAIDRKPLADLYGGGLAGKATCNILPSLTWVGLPAFTGTADTMPICKYDLAAANKLLDEAGAAKAADGIRVYKGTKMEIVYATTVNTLRQKEQDIVKNGWEQLGIKVTLKSVNAGVFFGTEGDDFAAKFFTDVEMFTNGAESPDPGNYLRGWTSAEIKTKAADWSGNNYERWSNKEYDALFAQFSKETDPAKRKDLIVKMNDLLVSDVVMIPLIARNSPVSGISKQLKGVLANPWDSEMWNIADWSK
jgi:peptide/nickel transport system substrate-binding protein